MKIIQALFLLGLTSCATIVDGGPDTINLMTSDGSQVQARINSQMGTQQVTLPTFITVPKSCSDISVQIIESDTNQQSFAVASSSVNPWIFGNIIFGGLIGLAVDAAAGNMCTYEKTLIVPVYTK